MQNMRTSRRNTC